MWKSARLFGRELRLGSNFLCRSFQSKTVKTVGSLCILGGTGFAGYKFVNNRHATSTFSLNKFNSSSRLVFADSTKEFTQPNTKVKPFPVKLTSDNEEYSLIGLGVRSVSFLSFHVYAVGIYLAENDRPKAKQILAEYGTDPAQIEKSLLDPEISQVAISKLLNGHVSLMLRIVPVRNTDFGHLKDGFVRTIMNQPRFKTDGNNETFGEGLNDLKKCFGRKLSVKKDSIMHLIRYRDGGLTIRLFTGEPDFVESITGSSFESLGKVEVPLVSELLFLQYLSGAKVSSEEARQNAVKSLATL